MDSAGSQQPSPEELWEKVDRVAKQLTLLSEEISILRYHLREQQLHQQPAVMKELELPQEPAEDLKQQPPPQPVFLSKKEMRLRKRDQQRAQQSPSVPMQPAASAPVQHAVVQQPASRKRSFEELTGPILAWVGGIAILLGITFFLAIAASRGWLDDTAKSILAAGSSLAFIGFGIVLRARYRAALAASAAVAAGFAGLYTTASVTSAVYELTPKTLGLVCILLTGGCATILAIRWRSQGLGALALFGPAVAQAWVSSSWPTVETWELAYLFVVSGWALCIQIRQRWHWVAFGVFLSVLVPWIVMLVDDQTGTSTVLVFLVAMVGLSFLSAIKRMLDSPSQGIVLDGRQEKVGVDPSVANEHALTPAATFALTLSFVLFTVQASALAIVGYIAIDQSFALAQAPALYLALLALCYGAAGYLFVRKLDHERSFIAAPAFSLALILADVAIGLLFDDVARTTAWSVAIPCLALFVRGLKREDNATFTWQEPLLVLGLGGQIIASTYNLLLTAGSPTHIGDPTSQLGVDTVVGMLSVAVACFVASTLFQAKQIWWRAGVQIVGICAVIYLTVLAFNGLALVVALSLQAGVFLKAHSYEKNRNQILAEISLHAAAVCLFLVLVHVFAYEAPPAELINGPHDLSQALLASGVVLCSLMLYMKTWLAKQNGANVVHSVLTATVLFVSYITTVALDGLLLVIAFCLEGGALFVVSWRLLKRKQQESTLVEILCWLAFILLTFASIHTLIFQAPPTALDSGVNSFWQAVGALAAITVALLFGGKVLTHSWKNLSRVAYAIAAVVGVYLASVAVVDLAQPSGSASQHERAQLLLSILWALIGSTSLIFGLLRRAKHLRVSGLVILLFAVGKVFLVDLQGLNAEYRVLSLIGLGITLLVSTAVWQRAQKRDKERLRPL